MSELIHFNGFIKDVFSQGELHSFHFDGKRLYLNLVKNDNAVRCSSFSQQIEYLSAEPMSDGALCLYDCICKNSLFNESSIILPAMYFLPKCVNIKYTKFDRMLFKGKLLNSLFPPSQKIKYDSYSYDFNPNLFNKDIDGSKIIELKTFDETDKKFTSVIDGEKIECVFGVYLPRPADENDDNLGALTSYFSVKFENSQDLKNLKKYYKIIRKLFQFLAKRQDVSFDEIEISTKRPDGKLERIGNFFDNTIEANVSTEKTGNVLLYLSHIDELLTNINNENINFSYIPENETETKYVSQQNYVMACGSFEHNYDLVFPEPTSKEKTKLKVIEELESYFKDKKPSANNETKRYYEHIIKLLRNDLISVESQYARCLKHFKSSIEEHVEQVKKNHKIDANINLANVFANFRNEKAHGELTPFSSMVVASYIVATMLIDCMILKLSNYGMEEIKDIIKMRYKSQGL